jgi:hypothetical protein
MRRRLARLHPPRSPAIEAESFEQKFAAEIAACAEEEGLDPDGIPAMWMGFEPECPCCVERGEEIETDHFWRRFVPLAPCDEHQDCRDDEGIAWACAAYQITQPKEVRA